MKRDLDSAALGSSTSPALAPQPISAIVLAEKYLKTDETSADQNFARVAKAVASAEKTPALRKHWEAEFLANMYAGAIGAGRIMSAAGTAIEATLINCFVQPVGDCIQGKDADGYPGIYEALREAAETMRRGGGVGYDFSRIRPKGAWVKKTASQASGPCSYINVFDQSCATVESAGSRRGAQMGVLRIDHPDVHEFITAKRTPGRWNNFNVSVAVTTEFMQAVEQDASWDLVHAAAPGPSLVEAGARQREDGKWVYRTVKARELWSTIMQSTYDYAEPGILYIDNMNRDNNLGYCERIDATNPCVTVDTWVQTSEGPQQVRDLIGKPFKAVVNGQEYPTLSRGFFRTGHKAVKKLRMDEGQELRLTADHKVLKLIKGNRGTKPQKIWVAAQDLKAGDLVVLHDHRPAVGWAGAHGRAEGYLMGALLGDGSLKECGAEFAVWDMGMKLVGNGGVLYSAAAAAVMHEIETAARTLPHRADFAGWQAPIIERKEVRMRSAAVRDLAISLGMTPGNKSVTPQMESCSSDFARGFIRGLLDADGSVQGSQQKGISVRLTQGSLPNLQAVQRMLQRLGIISTIYEGRHSAGVQTMPDGKGGRKEYMTSARHELIISGESIVRFADLIGFADTEKSRRLQDAIGAYNRAPNLPRFFATVRSLNDDGYEDVFDVTVAEVHAFDANGIYVHNCGEQPLPSYGCCDLGPVILTRFVRNAFDSQDAKGSFDFAAFEKAVAIQVRALDNVLEITHWPLEQQKEEAHAKRRIGVGFTGLGDTLVMLGLRYDREEGRQMATAITERMRDAAYRASIELAKEKGAFPLFNAEGFLREGTFASRLPEDIKAQIRLHGIRNSHLLSIAPTGTVSLAFADNASNGIEPAFSWTYTRRKRESDGTKSEFIVEDHAYRLYRSIGGDVSNLPPAFVAALEMSAGDHLAMMAAVQPFIDTSISKTVNVPADYPYEDFQGLYMAAWKAGLKGLATFRPNSILGAVLEVTPAKTPEPAAAAAPALRDIDPLRVSLERRPEGELASVTEKVVYWTSEGKKSLYLVVSFADVAGVIDGKPVTVQRPIEVFMPANQSDEAQQWVTATMRLMSLMAREGRLPKALSDLRKIAWDKGPVRYGHYEKADGTRVPRWHDSEVAAIAYAVQQILFRRGFLDADGGVVPAQVLAERAQHAAPALVASAPVVAAAEEAAPAPENRVMAGKKCHECGAHATVRRDGCDVCTACGTVGSCG